MTTIKTEDLEQLLAQLSSDLARSRVIEGLIKNEIPLSAEILYRGLKGYEENGKLINAGFLAHLAGRRREAKQYFETVISQEDDVSRLRITIDWAKTDIPWAVERAAEKAISLLEKQFPDPEALESAATIGQESNWYDQGSIRQWYLQAMRIREERGEYAQAAEDARGAGLSVKAIDLYLQASELSKAGELAQEIGLYERAVEIFVQDEEYTKALQAAEEGGLKNLIVNLVSKAIQKFEEEGILYGHGNAYKLALRYGLEDKADVLVKIGMILGISYTSSGATIHSSFFHP